MFDFFNSDWFTLAMEIVFLILIVYDVRAYINTKKNEYLINIVLTIGFFIWTIIPFYKSYITWEDTNKNILTSEFVKEYNATLGSCLSDSVFKGYTYSKYKTIDKNSTQYSEFLEEAKDECLDDSWF